MDADQKHHHDPVVITGLGTVSAAGAGNAPFAAALRESQTHLSPIDQEQGYHDHQKASGSKLAARADRVDLSSWLNPRAARRMSPPSKFAVAATKIALADAGLDASDLAEEMTQQLAVILATSFGPTSFTESILKQVLGPHGPESVSPFLFTESVANAPAAQVALACRALGPNITITQREAGPLIALARAASEIRLGRAGSALVLAVDELNSVLHSVLDRFDALASPDAQGREIARPFDRQRNGFLAAEGATVLLLEKESDAQKRNAPIIARLLGSCSAFDPDAPITAWGQDPKHLAHALQQGLERMGLEPQDINRIVSGASGSLSGDRLEALVLSSVWDGQDLPPILVPKAVTGEFVGSLLAGAALAARNSSFGATPGFHEADPELQLIPHDGRPLDAPGKILVSSLAAGGAAAWTVLESVQQGDGEDKDGLKSGGTGTTP